MNLIKNSRLFHWFFKTVGIKITTKIFFYFLFRKILVYFPNNKFFSNLMAKVAKIKKPFYVSTQHGNFLVHSMNALTVLRPNYEMHVQNLINSNKREFRKEKDKIFLNIGSHIGRYTILNALNGYKCIAFEPSPETNKFLKINCLLSNVEDKVSVYNLALGNKKGNFDFMYYPSHDGGSRMKETLKFQKPNKYKPKQIKVQSEVFDNLTFKEGKKNIRLIIIDVEGFELEVLKGMKSFLSTAKNVDIIIEIFSHNKNKDKVFDLMKKYGFSYKNIGADDWYFKKRSK